MKSNTPYRVQSSPRPWGDPLRRAYIERHGFATPEERAAWIEAHPDHTIDRLYEDYEVTVPAMPKGGPPSRHVDHLPGGSRDDYRLAGYTRY